jgi:hypothetical protein
MAIFFAVREVAQVDVGKMPVDPKRKVDSARSVLRLDLRFLESDRLRVR